MRLRLRRWGPDWAALLLLAVLTALFYWRNLTPDPADRLYFPEGDFTETFYVYRNFALQELRAGRFPLWMPCTYSGYALQADPQSALLYPPAVANLILALAMGIETFSLVALEVEAMLHVWAGGFFTYLFLRGVVKNRLAAILGGTVFAFGGYLTGYPPLQLAILESAVWLPLALVGARGLAREGRGRYLVLTAVALSMSVLAGHPQTYAFVFYVTVVYFGYRAWREGLSAVAAGRRIGVAVAAALLLSAAQLLPSLEYLLLSTRDPLSLEIAGTGFPTQDILQFAITGVVSRWQPLYVGILPLLLAMMALIGRRHRGQAWFWWGVALVALILAFGANLFGFEVAFLSFPPYRLFRGQERHAFLVSFALSVLAGYGADAFFSSLGREERRRLRSVGQVLVGALGVALLILFASRSLYGQEIANRVGLFFLMLVFTTAIFHGRRWDPARRSRWLLLSFLLVVIDLFSADRGVNDSEAYALYPETPLVASIASDGGIFRIQDDFRLPGNTACMHGLMEVWGVAPIRPAHYVRFRSEVPERVQWQLLGVKYLVTWRRDQGVQDDAIDPVLIHQEGEGEEANYVFRLSDDTPWGFVVRDVQVADDRTQALAMLGEPSFDPRASAVVYEPLSIARGEESTDEVTLRKYLPGYLAVDARLDSAGLLVTSEVTYPGWRAVVDGREVPILEANGLLKALPLEAGLHRVELLYDPRAFKGGLLISAATLAGFGAMILWSPLRRWMEGTLLRSGEKGQSRERSR